MAGRVLLADAVNEALARVRLSPAARRWLSGDMPLAEARALGYIPGSR